MQANNNQREKIQMSSLKADFKQATNNQMSNSNSYTSKDFNFTDNGEFSGGNDHRYHHNPSPDVYSKNSIDVPNLVVREFSHQETRETIPLIENPIRK